MLKKLKQLFRRRGATNCADGWNMNQIRIWGEELRKRQQEEIVFWR